MADTKVTGMTATTDLASTDVFYVVKPSTSPYDHKITSASLFGGIPVPVICEDDFVLGGTPQSLSSAGAISVDTLVTTITNPDGAGTCTIADGANNGQIKVILMTANTGGHSISITSNIGHTSIVFNSAGHTAHLMYQGGVWYFIGGTATVT